MRRILAAALLALSAAGPAVAQPGAEEARLEASLDRFSEVVNRFDPAAQAYFLPTASIIEDLAPYRWQGPQAPAQWMAGMLANAERSGMSGVNMRFLPATMVQITGERGYAVIPGELTYTFKDGAVRHAHGHVTFAVQKVAADWKIDSLTWAWESAAP